MKIPRVYASEEISGPRFGSFVWTCSRCGTRLGDTICLGNTGKDVECAGCGTKIHLGIEWVDKE